MKYIVLLLFICAGLTAQKPAVTGGKVVGNSTISPDDIPQASQAQEEPVDPDDTLTFSDFTLYYGVVDFESYSTGLMTSTDLYNAFMNGGADTVTRHTGAFTNANANNSQKPNIVNYSYDSSGVTGTSKGVRFTMIEGLGNTPCTAGGAYYMPINARVVFEERYNSTDTANLDMILVFDVQHINSVGFRSTTAQWKLNGLVSGSDAEASDDAWSASVTTWDYSVGVNNNMMGQGYNSTKHYLQGYPYADWCENASGDPAYVARNIKNPSDTSLRWYNTYSQENTYTLGIRVCLKDTGDYNNGFLEYFIDDEKADHIDRFDKSMYGDQNAFRNLPLTKMVDDTVTGQINGFRVRYHWGGGCSVAPSGSDAQVVMDNFYIIKIPSDHIYYKKPWPYGVPLPLHSKSNGAKKQSTWWLILVLPPLTRRRYAYPNPHTDTYLSNNTGIPRGNEQWDLDTIYTLFHVLYPSEY